MVRYINLIRNIANWHLHFMVKLGIAKEDPLVFLARNNILVEVPKRLHHEFKEIFMENAYSLGLKKSIKRRATIIDVGANVGFFSLFALSKYPDCRVYAYEPVKSNFEQLERNRELNGTRGIYCFNRALCGYSGTIQIHFDRTDSFTTSASILNMNENGEMSSRMGGPANIQSIEVPCLSLSDAFAEQKIYHCDLLKLDCEGAEYDVLYNAPEEVLHRIDQMAIEVHQGKKEGENLPSLKNFLSKYDFELFQFKDKPHMLWAYRDRCRSIDGGNSH